MFNRITSCTLLLAAVVLLSSCKYEEGPVASLQSREKRVTSVWEVAYATDEEGEEVTEQYESWEFAFEEEGEAELSYRAGGVDFNFDGEWNLVDDDERFQLIVQDPLNLFSSDREYTIERLTRNEFWLRDTEDTDRVIQLSSNL